MTTTRPHIAIAGSGLAGLQCAVGLVRTADVTVYERLPVAGGEHWEDPGHHGLVAQARLGGVRFAAGTQIVRWEGDRLLAVGEDGGIAAADALVVATGHRPPTRTELRIDGNRCAGVLPATLALHLLQQRVRLGRHIVVAGDAHWAAECIATIRAGRSGFASITWIGGPSQSAYRDVIVMPEARVGATCGTPRITGVIVESPTTAEHLICDSLILAGPALPYRNIDGAVLDDEPAIYAQRDAAALSPAQIGLLAARRALAYAQAECHAHLPVLPRIGLPR
jgi:D-hydroxyproline dehydrogenase subunit alpha